MLPAGASAGPIEDVLGNIEQTVNDTVNGLLGGSGGGGTPAPAPAPSAGGTAPSPAAAEVDPTISGTDPHATGTVLDANLEIIDLTPGEEDVIVGESSGEQDSGGDYHGQVIPVSALGLGIAVVQTDEGESAQSPLAPINDILDEICAGSGNNVCLNALAFSSDTTDSGSNNGFEAASANLGNGLVTANALSSQGNINEGGGCQTASSSSGTDRGRRERRAQRRRARIELGFSGVQRRDRDRSGRVRGTEPRRARRARSARAVGLLVHRCG